MIDSVLLALLADGAFHSGASLGTRLGISRSAIWKRVAALRELGLDVHSVPGKGYRLLPALELLSEHAIRAHLAPDARPHLDVLEVLVSTESTNDVVMDAIRRGDQKRIAVFAERQTSGRGRRGRAWVSPFGANIYLSLSWEFPGGVATLDGLSLAIGVALCEAMAALGISAVGLKWPNDVLLGGRKLAGILIEVSGEASGACMVVVGIGLNVGMPEKSGDDIDQPWTDLRRAGFTGSRNQVAGVVLNHAIGALKEFSAGSFSAFSARWRHFDVIAGRRVDVLVGEARVSGVAVGIDDGGALLVETGDGIRRFFGGEVSVREGA